MPRVGIASHFTRNAKFLLSLCSLKICAYGSIPQKHMIAKKEKLPISSFPFPLFVRLKGLDWNKIWQELRFWQGVLQPSFPEGVIYKKGEGVLELKLGAIYQLLQDITVPNFDLVQDTEISSNAFRGRRPRG